MKRESDKRKGAWCQRLAQVPFKHSGAGSNPVAPTNFIRVYSSTVEQGAFNL